MHTRVSWYGDVVVEIMKRYMKINLVRCWTSASSCLFCFQSIVRRLYGADRLLALSTAPVLNENNVQCAEQNLNYLLLLKNLLDVVPELEAALSSAESDLLRRIKNVNLISYFYSSGSQIRLVTKHFSSRDIFTKHLHSFILDFLTEIYNCCSYFIIEKRMEGNI